MERRSSQIGRSDHSSDSECEYGDNPYDHSGINNNKKNTDFNKLTLVKENKGGQLLEIFFDGRETKDRKNKKKKVSFKISEDDLDYIGSIEELYEFLEESQDNYYVFFKHKVSYWWTYIKDLIDNECEEIEITQDQSEYAIKIVFNMLDFALKSFECSQVLKAQGLQTFNELEISQFLNDKQIIKAFEFLAFEIPLHEHINEVIECFSILVQVMNHFNSKIKTSISYKLQDKNNNVFQQVLDVLQDELVINGTISKFNHHQFTNFIDLYLSFKHDKSHWLAYYEDMFVELMINLSKNCPFNLMVKPMYTYMTILHELQKEVYSATSETDTQTLKLYSAKMIRRGITNFIMDYYLKVQDESVKIDPHLSRSFKYYCQAHILQITSWCFNDSDLIETLCEDKNFIKILKVCIFDPMGHHSETYKYFRTEAFYIYQEISRLAIFNNNILEQLKREGFLDLTIMSLQDWNVYFTYLLILKGCLQNLHKAQSVQTIMTEQLYAQCA